MTDLRDFTVTTAELAALTERRRAAAGPRRSWASTQPFVAGGRIELRGADADSWRVSARRYSHRALAVDLLLDASGLLLTARLVGGAAAPALLLAATTFLVATGLAHGYDRAVVGDGPQELRAVLRGAAAAVVVPALLGAFFDLDVPRLGLPAVVVAVGALSLLLRVWMRRTLRRARRSGRGMARTLVVGRPEAVGQVVTDLAAAPDHAFQVVGVCLPSVEPGHAVDDVPVLGALADVPQVAYDQRIETVVVAGDALGADALRRLSWALGRTGANLALAPGLVDVLGPRISVRPTGGQSLLTVETVAPSRRLILKSALDRVLGGTLLLLAVPVIAVAALAVRLTDRGPVFFRQTRIGVDGRPFTMIKLRSMYVDAEERRAALLEHSDRDGVMFKMCDDPRVTPVGKVLRRFSVDELPQLWNVARGDMSLVGPRPPLPEEVKAYADPVQRRLHVRPGLTGLWQVSGRASLSWDESVRLDLRYVDNWSVPMDLLILLKTGRAVLGAKGAF